MEDRYEILGKIGQGGIGIVHRAYDHKVKREVAIKRILTSREDPTLQEEATKQLLVEARALSSLQHPHIVTILDVGVDEEGPYVVMELIVGKTLDEIIESAPLTWQDFKEVAMQSIEALLAAQELNMIHSDLKPPNVMLTWLPSGKFQVKILDFGLAVLVQNQSQEEIDKMETVFGSIFFMPPEQFERKTLDARSDLYSLGCCFYQALAGKYPFNGETAAEVMDAHLSHKVKPIQEIRGDIPMWACQWVMWLINRYREDRPNSAREALTNFVHNDKQVNPAMSQGGTQVKRPRLVIPTEAPGATTSPSAPETTTVLTAASTAVQVIGLPPDGMKESAPTAIPGAQRELTKSRPSKIQLKIAVAAALVLLIGILSWTIKRRNDRIRRDYAYSHFVTLAAEDGVTEVPISGADLQSVLEFIGSSEPNANLTPAFHALVMAKATDGANVDTIIAGFTSTAGLPAAIRQKLFEEVIEKRGKSAVVPSLVKLSARAPEPDDAAAAIQAIGRMIHERHAAELLEIISSTSHQKVRDAAKSRLADIIGKSKNRDELAQLISKSSKPGDNQASRQALSHLLELCKPKAQASTAPRPPVKPTPARKPSSGTTGKLKSLIETLNSNDDSRKIEALATLGKESDTSAHGALLNFAGDSRNTHLLTQSIQALVQLNSHLTIQENDDQAMSRWLQIIWRTKTHEQKKMVILALAAIKEDWAVSHIEGMGIRSDSATNNLARQVLEDIAKRGNSGKN